MHVSKNILAGVDTHGVSLSFYLFTLYIKSYIYNHVRMNFESLSKICVDVHRPEG